MNDAKSVSVIRDPQTRSEVLGNQLNPAGNAEVVDFEMEDLLAGLFPGSSSMGGQCCANRPTV